MTTNGWYVEASRRWYGRYEGWVVHSGYGAAPVRGWTRRRLMHDVALAITEFVHGGVVVSTPEGTTRIPRPQTKGPEQ